MPGNQAREKIHILGKECIRMISGVTVDNIKGGGKYPNGPVLRDGDGWLRGKFASSPGNVSRLYSGRRFD